MSYNDKDDNIKSNEKLRPFEWLTSAASLLPLIQSILLKQQAGLENADHQGARILHVGCGSSVLGEQLYTPADKKRTD
jgi:hypothetical protein